MSIIFCSNAARAAGQDRNEVVAEPLGEDAPTISLEVQDVLEIGGALKIREGVFPFPIYAKGALRNFRVPNGRMLAEPWHPCHRSPTKRPRTIWGNVNGGHRSTAMCPMPYQRRA
jgi:hypothetical protein